MNLRQEILTSLIFYKKNVSRFKNVGYNLNIIRHTAAVFSCTAVV